MFHLIVIVVAMSVSLSSSNVYEETYMLIDPKYIEDILNEEREEIEKELLDENFDIDKYIAEIRNVGSNYNNPSAIRYNQNINVSSEDELRQKYETELLKEKYGDDYEKMMNTSYENYLNDDYYKAYNENKNVDNASSNNIVTYNGIALVYVELDNKSRGSSYVPVPVFTCESGGTVVVLITINSDGTVRTATVETSQASDFSCINNAAKEAALRSRFTAVSGTKTEKGKITYKFIEQ